VDLEGKVVHWRAESDKIGFEHTTPLTDETTAVLLQARQERKSIGNAWVFPSTNDPSKPCPRSTGTKWWKRAVKLAKLDKVKRLGWHSLRRQFASEMRDVPLRDLAHMGGWRNAQTIVSVYQVPDEERQREGLAQRRELKSKVS
jgi:integrase